VILSNIPYIVAWRELFVFPGTEGNGGRAIPFWAIERENGQMGICDISVMNQMSREDPGWQEFL
jgi:hypothetical protein